MNWGWQAQESHLSLWNKRADNLQGRVGPRGLESMEILMSIMRGSDGCTQPNCSGGELSRIMLAVKQVIAKGDPVDVYIFDEVDAGVGGITAERIAHKLKTVSRLRQAICVTHLAQIAAQGDHHFMVAKQVEAGRTHSKTIRLDESSRIIEIARMLGGQQDSETAQAHAETSSSGSIRLGFGKLPFRS